MNQDDEINKTELPLNENASEVVERPRRRYRRRAFVRIESDGAEQAEPKAATVSIKKRELPDPRWVAELICRLSEQVL